MSEAAESEVAVPELVAPRLNVLFRERLRNMLDAGEEAGECIRVLKKGRLNFVGEMLKGQGTFYEFDHCPKGDVHDEETHARYYTPGSGARPGGLCLTVTGESWPGPGRVPAPKVRSKSRRGRAGDQAAA